MCDNFHPDSLYSNFLSVSLVFLSELVFLSVDLLIIFSMLGWLINLLTNLATMKSCLQYSFVFRALI